MWDITVIPMETQRPCYVTRDYKIKQTLTLTLQINLIPFVRLVLNYVDIILSEPKVTLNTLKCVYIVKRSAHLYSFKSFISFTMQDITKHHSLPPTRTTMSMFVFGSLDHLLTIQPLPFLLPPLVHGTQELNSTSQKRMK